MLVTNIIDTLLALSIYGFISYILIGLTVTILIDEKKRDIEEEEYQRRLKEYKELYDANVHKYLDAMSVELIKTTPKLKRTPRKPKVNSELAIR